MLQQLRASIVLAVVLGHLAIPFSATAVSKHTLTVTIDGLKNQRGRVCLSLFANKQGFPGSGDRALKSQCVKVGTVAPTITFQNLAAGNYAIAAIHDANSDGTLNRNGFGIPTEGFGFSRNPVIRTGPPSFGDAAVLVTGASTRIQIQLKYLLGG